MEHRIYVFERILPFELEIMYTRVKYWSGDHMGYLDALSALLRKCKRKTKEASAITPVESEVQEMKDMWKERGARVSLILASQLVEMKVRQVFIRSHDFSFSTAEKKLLFFLRIS